MKKVAALIFCILLAFINTACTTETEEEPNSHENSPDHGVDVEQSDDTSDNGEVNVGETDMTGADLKESSNDNDEDEERFESLINNYKIFSSHETEGPGTGLGEGMEFHSVTDQHALAEGHEGHAVAVYHLFDIDHDNEEVRFQHTTREGEITFNDVEYRLEENEDPEEVTAWLAGQESNRDELYFSADAVEELETITYEEETMEAAPVEENTGTIRYFKEDVGLLKIRYTGEQVEDVFGGEITAERNNDFP
ncbi:hypothetical protein [Salsuginibacillus halophilus]|nr:hypothetical protein [Salsuginibacillus halophilus]